MKSYSTTYRAGDVVVTLTVPSTYAVERIAAQLATAAHNLVHRGEVHVRPLGPDEAQHVEAALAEQAGGRDSLFTVSETDWDQKEPAQ